MRSFTSVWYWIVVAVVWSTTAHWTLGVPFDMVTRARRAETGPAQDDLEMLTRINADRLVHIMDVSGSWVVGLSFFFLSILVILGFWYTIEIAQAVFLITGPMTLVAMLSVRYARHIAAEDPRGHHLRSRLARQRFFNQVIGLVSIFITAFWGMWHNLSATVL